MRNFQAVQKQQGAVLIIALVMLLVLTVLAVSNMRGVVLESRITASRAETQRLQDMADAALREGEFRLSSPISSRDALEINPGDCKLTNILKTNGLNKPCLLKEITDADDVKKMFDNPIAYLGGSGTTHNVSLYWMPYRGLDASGTKNYVAEDKRKAFWNIYQIPDNNPEGVLNVEFGMQAEGVGTYFYLVNGQANDELTVQSSVKRISLGFTN